MGKLTENDSGEVILVNVMEEIVRQRVNELIKDFDMCDCQKCRLNVCAIALNHLPTHYVTTEKGALFSKLEEVGITCQTNITVEITKALMTVKKHPFH
ncbi:MAG: competence protein ComFB [Clostridia bacterium]|nr:competence protein ComFB [Clostridia bacterium]